MPMNPAYSPLYFDPDSDTDAAVGRCQLFCDETSVVFALIDVNGMYAACRSAFRPDGQPCGMLPQQQRRAIVAPEPAYKTGGTENGGTLFQSRPLIEAHNVAVFSSNHTLYASMSARFAAVVESLSSVWSSIQLTNSLWTVVG